MVTKIKNFLKKIRLKRTTVVLLVFVLMSAILIQKLFQLQIAEGEDYASRFNNMTLKTRTLKSTRGTIYDRNGNILAGNKLSYALTIEDNGTYDSTRIRNLSLNGTIYRVLKIMEQFNDEPSRDFHVIVDDWDNYAFDVSEGVTLNRFRADIYGHALIDDLKDDEAKATAEEMMEYLTGSERFAVVLEGENAYTDEELETYGMPQKLTKQEILDIVIVRYGLSNNSFQKYVPVTIATDISEEAVASIMENQDELQGIDITEDSLRYYEDAIYFANILGYTGKASTEELEELQKENKEYSLSSIVGKTGIEKYMETELQGQNGEETVYVDTLGKVLEIDEDTRKNPKVGNDVYLTIDKNLQIACYKILEQRIAGILLNNITQAKTFDRKSVSDASHIQVPIYDIYNALVGNNIIDITHFYAEDASETEKSLYTRFQQKQSQVFDRIKSELTTDSPVSYKELTDEMQDYVSYVVDDLLTTKLEILSSDAIDSSDPTYIAWNEDQSISLQEYLTYAASQNWVDLSQLSTEGDYLDSREIYAALGDYITEYLGTDTAFSRLLYKYMLLEDTISGAELCTVLYDQGVLSKDDGMYDNLITGKTSAYDFMITKISNLEITPGQLALEPCSGSVVITDPNSGQVLACASYPGYDNNRLANTMDVSYYNKLLSDQAQPFFNKATQQRTAPGSTLKLVSAIAGMGDKLIDDDTYINCNGKFDLVSPSINCWNRAGHGNLEIKSAIEQSCNVFFTMLGFQAGKNADDEFSEAQSLQVFSKYASLLDLDKKTGIEIDEASPHVSDEMAVPSYIGQGTHLYTTSELARYAGTLANGGTSYKLTLIASTADTQGNILEENKAKVESKLNVADNVWNDVHEGMQRVVATHREFDGLGMTVAGKTGTAQQTDVPDHGLFIGYAPYDDPEIAIAVRIPNGYSSGNACLVANDVFKYAFDLEGKDKVITGVASAESSNTSND